MVSAEAKQNGMRVNCWAPFADRFVLECSVLLQVDGRIRIIVASDKQEFTAAQFNAVVQWLADQVAFIAQVFRIELLCSLQPTTHVIQFSPKFKVSNAYAQVSSLCLSHT